MMSDQFHRHAQQFHQRAAEQSVERARQWQQDMFKHQRDMQAFQATRADSNDNTVGAATGERRRGSVVRTIVVLVVLCALAAGVIVLIRSAQLSAWLDLKDF
jgi:hypothetical protein